MAEADDDENTSPPYFSPDIVLEILVRLPPSARRRCRLVCQSWRDAVDTHTTEMQSRAKPLVATTGLAYVVDDLSPPARSRLLWKDGVAHREEGTSVVGTCNGLICLCDNRESGGAITLINPATDETLAIPPLPCAPGTDACCWHETYSFAYHPTTGRYNVVHVPCYYDSARVFRSVQVFTLGEASWRDVVTPPAAICNRSAGVVSVDGATYWVVNGTKKILRLDLGDERVTSVQPIPSVPSGCSSSWHLMEVHGKLGIAFAQSSHVPDSNTEVTMSSAAPAAVPIASAPAAAAVAPAPAVAMAAPAAAPASPFLASRPLSMWWPAPGAAPPGALAGSASSSVAAGRGAEGDPPPIINGGPPSSTNAPLPSYGGHPPPPIYGAQPAPAYGWSAPTYGTPPMQPYAVPPLPHYGAASATPYGAPAAPIAPYGAYPSSSYDAAPAPVSSMEVAPPAPFYAPPSPAHADPTAPSPFYFSHLLPLKLTPDNYLSWRAQVLPLLRSRYLEGYVDGSLPCPPVYHPAYHAWVAQDQAILSAIQSSLTPSVSSLVLFASTSRDAWTALHSSFASQSQARAHAIRTELGETKLLDSSITDYFNKMAGLADTLASIGQPLRSEDFTTYVLNGLDDDYDNLVENISGRDDPLPRRELYSRLLGREQRVKVKNASPSFSAANAAARGKPQKLPLAGGKSTPGPQQPQRSAAPPVTGGNRPRACCPSCGAQQACQLCGLDNHIASRCHRRFKQDFLGIGNNGKGNDKQAAAAVTGQEHGYTPSYPIDSSWYMDTGATNHLTSEMSKLSTQEPYRGHDQVRTANGAGIGRGTRLELLDDQAPDVDHVQDVDPLHAPCMPGRARLPAVAAAPSVTPPASPASPGPAAAAAAPRDAAVAPASPDAAASPAQHRCHRTSPPRPRLGRLSLARHRLAPLHRARHHQHRQLL
ncbi:hypothetical protein QYE76_065742 [Lolium multiflorum]|uniref:F-box domain-containing protein n=1 Tax=Lolium multiflorum TaxID=4521 RepID=A0AAD8SBG6_LOLMU|nr:hypothetical protein QYE76_065742 [Lolium multiflorum]